MDGPSNSSIVRRPTPLRPGLRLRWPLFRVLERLTDLRGNTTADKFELAVPRHPEPAVWVFVSTIGELNAVDPWLRRLTQALGRHRLVLITDHSHYRASYEARYPQAVVCVSHGHGNDAAALARHYPPALLAVAEIPALPSDAPCRFSVAFVVEAKRRGAVLVLVNGWLYGYVPVCTMDAIERRLFARDYLRAFDMLCVQNAAIAERLLALGAKRDAIHVCGNIKFDAMQRPDWSPVRAHSPRLLDALLEQGRPVLVAGCVTSDAEQRCVLQAFAVLRQRYADALLVLAPRHPEVAERMARLRELLSQHGMTASFRSELGDNPLPAGQTVLVLDTMGDLRDFYAAATVAHVGVDHNVLEPLAFERPVSIMPGWEPTYPSYPVFQSLVDAGVLRPAADVATLSQQWIESVEAGSAHAERMRRTAEALSNAQGAVERHFDAMTPLLGVLHQ